ncbi:MAG: hypothetical protein WC342_07700 [Methanoregula sp.]
MAFFLCFLVSASTAAVYPGTSTETTSSVAVAYGDPIFIPSSQQDPAGDPAGNYTKLEIMPSYMHFMIRPGENSEQVVTIRNRDKRPVTINPVVRQNIYNGVNQAEKSWISISPAQAVIPAGQSAKFTIRVALPNDTLRGAYNSQVGFTSEQYPSAYPPAYPSYIHSVGISIDAAATPVVRIDPSYINDPLESGEVYRYTVTLTNSGSAPISLSPKISSDNYLIYASSGPVEPALNASSFALKAPTEILPKENATMTLTVNVPARTSGTYSGYIDLGIDDPGLREGEGRVSLLFTVWQQPAGAFTRQFSMSSSDTITIRLTATSPGYPQTGSFRDPPEQEPAFDLLLTGPSGNVAAMLVKKEIRGTVSVGGDPGFYGTPMSNEYLPSGRQYSYTYTAQGWPGQWTLAVIPKNTQTFEYTIGFGNDQAASPVSFLQPAYATSAGQTRSKTVIP